MSIIECVRTSDAYRLLSAVLDPQGYIGIVGLKSSSKPVQSFFPPGDYQAAVNKVMQLCAQGQDSYFCTSTLKDGSSRKADNVHRVRCLKIDIDVAPENPAKYASKRHAVAELGTFCEKTKLPVPAVVDSGNGLHAYWSLTGALDADAGKRYGEKLKVICAACGLKADPAVTGDLARILRVPGTMNFKDPAHPKAVKLKISVEPVDTGAMLALLDKLYNEHCGSLVMHSQLDELTLGALPAYLQHAEIDDTTRSLLEGRPKSFAVLLEKSLTGKGCAQIADIFRRQAEQDEPRWRGGLSVAYYCADGGQAIHDLSCRYPNYRHDETLKKASQIAGPYTCKTFESNWPALCKECPHKGKVASPIVLGTLDVDDGDTATGTNDDGAAISRLAALSRLEYDRVRAKEAKALRVRTSVLDSLVEEARAVRQENTNLPFIEVEPWDDEIDLAEVLHEIAGMVRRFIVCAPEVSVVAALWTAMTWVVDALKIAPLAVVTAPEKRCGKSEFRRLLAKLVYRPLEADGMSASVLFRGFDLWKPTLLVDEYDTFVQDDEDLRGIFNAGHQRGGCIWRCVGEEHEPRRFDVFGPKLLAGIGKLPDTMMDRAIIFELRRKLAHEEVDRLRYADETAFDTLRRKLARFQQDYLDAMRTARPALPDALNDRQQDNCEPLLAIADLAGGDWPNLARQVALTLCADKSDAVSMGVEMLADVREVFAERGGDRLFSYQLVHALCRDERRWCTHNRGGNITAAQVARILKGFGISPKSIRIDFENAKGYEKTQFADAWERYLPPPA